MVVLFLNPLDTKAFNIDNQEFYDSYNTLLAPYASQVIRRKLANHQYSLTDTKIIKLNVSQKKTLILLLQFNIKLI